MEKTKKCGAKSERGDPFTIIEITTFAGNDSFSGAGKPIPAFARYFDSEGRDVRYISKGVYDVIVNGKPVRVISEDPSAP